MTSKTKETTTRRRTSKNANSDDDSRERHRCIAEAAYYNAERRGFAPGKECDDWLEAEREFESQSHD